MDAEILSDRLSATEDAVIKLDERLDEAEETDSDGLEAVVMHDHTARIATLEERLNECLTKLQSLETAKAEAEAAQATAEAAQATALAAEALALAAVVEEPEEPEMLEASEVQEIAPEPESEVAPEKSSSWLERFLVLR